ncbi:alcohol dehydrogenase IV [Auriculariales sp. MPI-PUGE-AT-0066]|nr:alcohol dehydrogenase IV [Auriculariales sp. MPI-PUGE-AT-0066]
MSTGTNLYGSYGWTDTLRSVEYGPGSYTTALPKLLKLLEGSRALVVTGKSLHEKTDVVRKVESVLKANNTYGATFWEIGEHAPVAGVRNGVEAFKNAGADIIVAVGGGSPIDASKAILYFLQKEQGGAFKRQIAIPTTLSAAEYTIGAGYKGKSRVNDQQLAPAAIILDAELTLATPAKLWLSTGIRALDHAVESLYRPVVVPPLKALCHAAIADLFTYLPRSKADPADLEARQRLQLASWMSLWPIKLEKYSALGLSHALGHKLGAKYSIGHGITSCLTLAPTVHLMATETSHDDKEWLAGSLKFIGLPSSGNLENDIHKLADAIEKLVQDLGLKSTLTEYNVPREDAVDIAVRAVGGDDKPLYPATLKIVEGLY